MKDKTIFFAVRAIDDSLSLYSGSLRTGEDSTFPTTLIWRRQEGLASLEGSLIVDLPVDMTKYAQLKAEFEEKNYFERAFSQATHVLVRRIDLADSDSQSVGFLQWFEQEALFWFGSRTKTFGVHARSLWLPSTAHLV